MITVSAEDILSRAVDFNPIAGIYFLIKGDRVIYVGQSIDVIYRIHSHRALGRHGKKFDSFSYIECSKADLDLYESIYIHLLRPELNAKLGKAQTMCAPIGMLELSARGILVSA